MITWTIGTDSDSLVADALVGETRPTVSRGDEITLTFRFSDETGDGLLYDAGNYGSGPYGASVGQTAFDALLDYLDYVRAVTTFIDLQGVPYFRETTSDGSSLLMSFDPHPDVDTFSFWGVVVDGTNNRNAPGNYREIELSVVVLAELDEYADRTAIETARKLN